MQKRWSVPRNKIKRYKNLHLNPNSQAHLFLGILFIGRIIILNLFLFSIRQVVLGAETVFQRKTTNWSHLKFFFIHDQSNLKCYQSEQWLPQWKTCKPKIWLFLLLFVCVVFLHWCWLCFVLFLIIHRHNCIFWVKAAHQLPLFIDLFIFIYLFRKKNKEHSLCPSCDQSSSRDSRHVHLDGEKDLEEHERDSFWTPGDHIISVANL